MTLVSFSPALVLSTFSFYDICSSCVSKKNASGGDFLQTGAAFRDWIERGNGNRNPTIFIGKNQ